MARCDCQEGEEYCSICTPEKFPLSTFIEIRIQEMSTALSGPSWNRDAIIVYLREFAQFVQSSK